jgi:hypothetical protein
VECGYVRLSLRVSTYVTEFDLRHIVISSCFHPDREKADLKIITTFDEQPVPILIDITVNTTHAVSHYPRTIIGANGGRYSSKLSDHGAHLKEKKHAHYLHDGNAIGFALDSMGGISKSAKDLLDQHIGKQEKRRRWDSETMRIALKK